MDLKKMLHSLRMTGLTEQDIAKAIQANQSTVSRILSGKIHDPRTSLAHNIKHLFETQVMKTSF